VAPPRAALSVRQQAFDKKYYFFRSSSKQNRRHKPSIGEFTSVKGAGQWPLVVFGGSDTFIFYVSPEFCCAHKIYFKHAIKTNILPPKNVFSLKP